MTKLILSMILLSCLTAKNKKKLADALLQQAISGVERNGLLLQTQQLLKLEGINSQLNYITILKEKLIKT
jgi:hypothetical protein